jgi:hypothetical protein
MPPKPTKRGSLADVGLRKLLDTKYNWPGGPGGYKAFTLYLTAGMTNKQLSKIFNVSVVTIGNWRRQYEQEQQ